MLFLGFQIYKKLRILFLGTGTSQGVPIIACNCDVCQSEDPHDKRLRSSVLIEIGGKNIIIDTGPDFRQQMLVNNVKHLEAIILTHSHKDHISGLDDIRAFNYFQQSAMDVYAKEDVVSTVKKLFSYAFIEERYPGVPEIELHEIINQPFRIENTEIIPIRAIHNTLEIFGYRINDFVYITDASEIPTEEKDKMRDANILVINALRKNKHYSHFNLAEALSVIAEVKPRKAYITHISDQMGLHRLVQAELPPDIYLAYDGLVLEC